MAAENIVKYGSFSLCNNNASQAHIRREWPNAFAANLITSRSYHFSFTKGIRHL